jgi:predicted nucleotidyltransferase
VPSIADIMRERDRRRQAEAALLAASALLALRSSGMPSWVVGSLARGEFRQHSDIDILIDVPPPRKTEALRLCLDHLHGFPSSIVFKDDVPPDALAALLQEAADEPRLRG